MNWIPKILETDESFEEIFYLAFATGDSVPNGIAYVGPSSKKEIDFLKNESLKDAPKVKEMIEVPKEEPEVQILEETESVQDVKPATEEISTVQKEELLIEEDIPQVKFDVTTLSKEQLTTEYIQNLLDKIANLEQSGTALNRTELLQLNAELDAILSVLRQ